MGKLMGQDAPAYTQLQSGDHVFITGASGFLGRHLMRVLRHSAIIITATHLPGEAPPAPFPFDDATSAGAGRNKKESSTTQHGATTSATVDWVSLDITDHQATRTLLHERRPDIIIHLAATTGSERSYTQAGTAVRVNFDATNNLMIAAGEMPTPVRRLVLIGTAEEYGNAEELPITEDAPIRPVSPYSASKAATTQFAQLYHTLFALPVVILRPFIVYGPGQPASMMLPQLIAHILRSEDFPMTPGEQTRDFVYVDDVIEAIVLAATHPRADGEVFNICSGKEHSIRSIAERMLQLMHADIQLRTDALPYRPNEAMRLFGSNEKARTLLDWQPRVGLDEGLQRSIAWYRSLHASTQNI
ncbi:MAG: NAD-dependent epimerase/dehydratase family protein [Bacteroidetes bacterium]|nr:NAD-dependent epimerase/dehydratase family protein [Bacteroidota bacterium]